MDIVVGFAAPVLVDGVFDEEFYVGGDSVFALVAASVSGTLRLYLSWKGGDKSVPII